MKGGWWSGFGRGVSTAEEKKSSFFWLGLRGFGIGVGLVFIGWGWRGTARIRGVMVAIPMWDCVGGIVGMQEHERHRLLLVPRKGDSAVLFGLIASTAVHGCTVVFILFLSLNLSYTCCPRKHPNEKSSCNDSKRRETRVQSSLSPPSIGNIYMFLEGLSYSKTNYAYYLIASNK